MSKYKLPRWLDKLYRKGPRNYSRRETAVLDLRNLGENFDYYLDQLGHGGVATTLLKMAVSLEGYETVKE